MTYTPRGWLSGLPLVLMLACNTLEEGAPSPLTSLDLDDRPLAAELADQDDLDVVPMLNARSDRNLGALDS